MTWAPVRDSVAPAAWATTTWGAGAVTKMVVSACSVPPTTLTLMVWNPGEVSSGMVTVLR